jgi:hypothetical protein
MAQRKNRIGVLASCIESLRQLFMGSSIPQLVAIVLVGSKLQCLEIESATEKEYTGIAKHLFMADSSIIA